MEILQAVVRGRAKVQTYKEGVIPGLVTVLQ
jgi:hypothetical protein